MFCEISGFAQNSDLMKDYSTMIQERIAELYEVLAETVSENDMARIKDAFELALEAHKDQYRKSGLPYIIHHGNPIENAVEANQLTTTYGGEIIGHFRFCP